MDNAIPARFMGTEVARVVQGPSGPRDYVEGTGADMVPTKTGTGDVTLTTDADDASAIVFEGVNALGQRAILTVARSLVNDRQELTRENILDALAAMTV